MEYTHVGFSISKLIYLHYLSKKNQERIETNVFGKFKPSSGFICVVFHNFSLIYTKTQNL